ncbi:hypothetical protein SRHO_G00342400 [Serrasalmus rhombeus]
MCSAFAESAQGAVKDGQQGCSSKGRKQERAQRERRARYALKPAPPFTLMLRLGRSQGSCPKGPRKSYLPGRGDTMITKVTTTELRDKSLQRGLRAQPVACVSVASCARFSTSFKWRERFRGLLSGTTCLRSGLPHLLSQPIGTTAGVLAL